MILVIDQRGGGNDDVIIIRHHGVDVCIQFHSQYYSGEQQIATHALVLMKRGLKSNLKLSAASYATVTTTSEQK